MTPLLVRNALVPQSAARGVRSNFQNTPGSAGSVEVVAVPLTQVLVSYWGLLLHSEASSAPAHRAVSLQASMTLPVLLYSGCAGPVGVVPSSMVRTKLVIFTLSGMPCERRLNWSAEI